MDQKIKNFKFIKLISIEINDLINQIDWLINYFGIYEGLIWA